MRQIELLAPARDLAGGVLAIDCSADAVYIGAKQFGARARAGNPLEDIAALVEHAHAFWARVYVTVNTLLHDEELPEAVRLIHELYDMGVDAVIIQDVGLLECDLPPIALIASTQMHNHTPERVAFLEHVGIQRAILARELSLEEIRAVRARTSLELECFVHGALCVSYSGQCYMSYAIGGRSGNRGECAQPCRRRYTLVNGDGRPIAEDQHLLSLRDLNLSDYLDELLDAGITSFKIEGRLKDQAYIANVVSWYRQRLDSVLAVRGWRRSSSGRSSAGFEPDLNKTFNRGYTSFFVQGRREAPGAVDSPKMVGEYLGRVTALQGRSFVLDTQVPLHSGDGLCWFDAGHDLTGTTVNSAWRDGNRGPGMVVIPATMAGIRQGLQVYRNRDHAFLKQVERGRPQRKVAVRLRLESTLTGFELHVEDEDSNRATGELVAEKVPARRADQAEATAHRQLGKSGDSVFECTAVQLAWDRPCFLQTSVLNTLRRATLERLGAVREANRPLIAGERVQNDVPFPAKQLSFRANALNQKAVAFYKRHGVDKIAPAAESGLEMRGEVVMRTRYCIRHQLGLCDGKRKRNDLREPLYLVGPRGHRYRLRFDCKECEMEVYY